MIFFIPLHVSDEELFNHIRTGPTFLCHRFEFITIFMTPVESFDCSIQRLVGHNDALVYLKKIQRINKSWF